MVNIAYNTINIPDRFVKMGDALRDSIPFIQFKKKVKSTHGGVLLFVKFAKSNIPQFVLFKFFKLDKWFHIVQRITTV